MALRTQKLGGPVEGKVWTAEDIKEGLDRFYAEYKKFPTSTEIDSYKYLPSSKTIQRRFGGLIVFRSTHKVKGQADFRSGEHSRQRAFKISKRAHLMEAKVYKYLQNVFGREFVRRKYFFTNDKRTRADFFVYDSDKGFCVDLLHPSSRQNLVGCLNRKLDKQLDKYVSRYPLIYLQMNDEIKQDVLDEVIKSKKRKLQEGQYLMSWGTFQDFCKGNKVSRKLPHKSRLVRH